jgi:hypothetical protein
MGEKLPHARKTGDLRLDPEGLAAFKIGSRKANLALVAVNDFLAHGLPAARRVSKLP